MTQPTPFGITGEVLILVLVFVLVVYLLIIEESLLHVFHSLLHKVWEAIKYNRRFTRTFELFFYTHQQFLRRAAIERQIGRVLKKRKKNSPQNKI